MNILIGLVIAMFVITGAYVGYHASQQPADEGAGHSINTEFELLAEHQELSQVFQFEELRKTSTV